MKKILLPALLGVLLALAGCASTGSDSQLTQQLVIQYAVLKVVGDNPEKAKRVGEIAREAKTFLNGDGVTVLALSEAVRDKIEWTKLDPADTLLVNALLAEIDRHLAVKLGEGVLSPEQLVTVNEVLDWVIAISG